MIAKKEARNTNFIFMVGNDRQLSFSVQTSNVADVNMSPAYWPTGPKRIKYPDNTVEQVPLVIDMLVSEDMNEWIEIYKWIMDCKNTNNGLDKAKPCFLQVLDSQNKPGVTFRYSDAFPIDLSGLQYVTTEDGSRILTVTCSLEYNQFSIELPSGEIIDESYVTE